MERGFSIEFRAGGGFPEFQSLNSNGTNTPHDILKPRSFPKENTR
jgi:hypothetical protein